MKIIPALALGLSMSSASASLIVTGVYDGPLTGGTPKGIEIYATSAIVDLSIYGVGSANNGGGTDGEEFTFPAVTIAAGEYLYIASESTQFAAFLGFAPDYTDFSMGINGDDAIELFMNGSVIDTFGDISVDGNGEPWEYLDGWAYRNSNTVAGSFVLSDWTFSGANAWDGETTNAAATSVMPIGTFVVPEPSAALLGGLGFLALLRRRR